MSKKARLSVKEHQKLKVLLDAIDDDSEGADSASNKAEKQAEMGETAAGCISEGEIQRFTDLGLGRGIDASNPTPWQNKTSIQVRSVTSENIVGTEESGSIQGYEREITRVSETHWRFSSSAVFNPNVAATFAIGVEESPPRSSSSKKYIIGTKVLNRTICFKEICDDCNSLEFEVWLCRWILKQFVTEDGRPVDIDEKIDVFKRELVVVSEEFEALQGEFSKLKSKHEAAVAENAVESIQAELQELEHKKKMNEMEREKLDSKKKWFLNTLEKEYKKTGQSDEKQYKLEEFDQDFKLQEIKVNKESSEMERRMALLEERCASEKSRLKEMEGRLTATKEAMMEKERALKEKKDELKKTESHKFTINEFRSRLDSPQLQPNKVADYCAQFLAQYRVTHYVSSIQLGASGYKIISKNKDTKSQKVRNTVTIDKIAAGKETSASSRSKVRGSKSSDRAGVNKIGIIEIEEDNKIVVKRRSHQEGVVGIQVKPISDLVTTRELRETLRAGLLHYVRSEGNTNGYNYTNGPFSIRCQIDEKTFYWTMDDFHTVRVEDCNPEEAAKFYIKPRSHPDHLNEFYIVYYDSENKKHADPFLPHYLQRSVALFDTRGANQPLSFGHYSPEKDTPLALYKPVSAESSLSGSMQSIPSRVRSTLRRNRRRDNMVSVSLSSWIAEHDAPACVIQHARQSLTSTPIIIGVTIPSPIPDPEQQQKPEEQVQNGNETTSQHEESEQVDLQQQEETRESEELGQESQQEVNETQDARGQGSLPGEPQETAVVGRLVHQVVWMESSDSSSRGGVIKMFEIVPTQNN